MALTKTQVSSLYVAIFNRASEGSGNRFWQDTNLSANEVADQMLETKDAKIYFGSSLDSDQAFIEHIYANTLNKTIDDDPEGIAFWVEKLQNGESRGEVVVDLIYAVNTYADSTDPLTKAAYEQFTNRVAVSDFMASQVDAVPESYATVLSFGADIVVTDDNQTVIDAMQRITELKSATEIHAEVNNVFTLQKVVDETITYTKDAVTTTQWGNEGHQISMDQFNEMVRTVTGQDLFELAGQNVDIDGTASLTDVYLTVADADSDAGGDSTITYTTATGEQFTSELALGQEYIKLLDSLIYYTDAEGNKVSRFSSETHDEITQSSSFSLAPVVLTPNVNNGATFETGFTSDENDLIVVGQTELLHGAYIDGGAGINTLEVSMKGVYAQPVQLLNIQNVKVENLPNVYSDYYDIEDAHKDGYDIPDYLDLATATANQATANAAQQAAATTQATAAANLLAAQTALDAAVSDNESNDNGSNNTNAANDDATAAETLATLRAGVTNAQAALDAANADLAAANADLAAANHAVAAATNIINSDSILDLSNARDMDNLIITEGRNTGNDQAIGNLTVVGVNGDATVVMEGSFMENAVNVYYSDGLTNGVNLTLNLGDVGANTVFSIFHESNTININSIGGGNNLTAANFGDATFMNLNIAGDAEFVVTGSMKAAFTAGHPADIDASANTAGVDLDLSGFNDEVVFTGTLEADDHFTAIADGSGAPKSILINERNGDNEIKVAATEDVTITIDGNGDNQIDATSTGSSNLDNEDVVTITVNGDGNNDITASSTDAFIITAGNGDNRIDATTTSCSDSSTTDLDASTIVVGDGQNEIDAMASLLNITTGNGNNEIDTDGATNVTITTGEGNDVIHSVGNTSVTIDAGDGANTVTTTAKVITITTGEGNDSVTIGGTASDYTGATSTYAMLSIDLGAGANTLVLGTDDSADLPGVIAQTGSTITGENITLDVNKTSNLSQATLSGVTAVNLDGGDNLTISAEQFIAIGAENFSVDGEAFGEHATLTLVVSQSMNFNDLGISGDTFACDNIDLNIVLACTGKAENVLTITAEQLDTYIAPDGIRVDYDNGYDNNQVVITEASLAFDAFAPGVGSIDDQTGKDDVTVLRDIDGYSRPTEDTYLDYMNIDTDVDTVPAAIGDDTTLLDTLNIKGSQDITTTVNLGNNFTIDFSELTGTAHLTVADFEDMTTGADTTAWGSIVGNGTTENPARVNVTMSENTTVGSDTQGISVSGVQTLVVTDAAETATVYLCETSDDIETVGLQGNWGDAVTFENVAWDVDILMEAALTQKTNTYDVGSLSVNYETDNIRSTHASGVVVDINNAGTAVANGIWVQSLAVANASDLTINAADGDVKILSLTATDATSLTLTSAEDVTVNFADANFDADFNTLNATDVAGTFTLNLVGDIDLSNVNESGIDAITFGTTTVALTLTADQAMTLGSVIVDNATTTSTLNVNDFSTQALDLSAVDVDNIGTVTTADVDGTIVLDEAANLGDANALIINALTSDTTLQMTVDQFHTYCGSTNEAGTALVGCNVTGTNEATLKLTGATADSVINLTNVDQTEDAANAPVLDAVSVTVVLDNVVATDDFEITNGTYTLEVSGTNDLTKADIAGAVDVNFTADATLTLTAQQIADIEAAYDTAHPGSTESAFSVAEGANVTVNVTDLSTQAVDLDALQAAGINIGTVSIADTDTAITLAAGTTFGGADTIITPTADQSTGDAVDGIEPTSLTMTIQQLATSAGVITGDAQVNLTGLVNNVDSDNDYVADQADYDLSHINNAGTVEFTDQNTAETVTLADTANLGDFAINLHDGDMIQFATEAQASGVTVNEVGNSATTAVAWLFTNTTAAIDTVNYDGDINTLYVNEDLVDGINEESLWTTLPQTITVEKVNAAGIPDVLMGHNRVNTFEALSAIEGVNYDDEAEFATVANLTINLEGNTNIGNVQVGDTHGEGALESLTINSYEDRSTIENDNGFTFQPNKVGDISLNANADDNLTNITINTYVKDGDFTDGDGFNDTVNVNAAAAERDGMAIEVGTINFASGKGDTHAATLTLTGAEDISIADIAFSDPDIQVVTVDATGMNLDGYNADGAGTTLKIGGTDVESIVASLDTITYVKDYTAVAGDTIGDAATNDLLVVSGDTDLTLATVDAEAIQVDADATVTMTADQAAAIGFTDANTDGIADNWHIANGANVTLNITGLESADVLDLNAVQAAGFNIGTITLADADVTLAAGTTLGGADNVVASLSNTDRTFTLTAEQYKQITNGNITESDSDATVANKANVTITDLNGIATDTNGDTIVDTVNIDLSTVNTTGAHRVELADAATPADLTMDATTDLGDFTVVLDSQGTALNDLAGQTVRFSTAVQAERAIDVINDDGADDNGTNVVWLFDSITGTATSGKVDTSNYDAELGRLWMTEGLVDGQNVEELFTSIANATIIRVVNSDDLTTVLPATHPLDRHVEIESFTTLDSLTFSDIDQAADTQFDFVQNLTLDLGANVDTGDITVSNILAAPISNDDEFDTITINSLKPVWDDANHNGTVDDGELTANGYLLPEGYTYGNNPGEVQLPTAANVVGDIKSGSDDFDMGSVTIDTHTAATGGNDLTVGTITFTDDGDQLLDGTSVAKLTLKGDGDVTIAAIDTSDADITGLTIDTTAFTGTLDPVMHMDNTETLTITGAGAVSLEEVEGDELSFVTAGNGVTNITLSQIDSNNDDRNNDGDTTDAGDAAFTYTAGTGVETVVVKAMNGSTPTLDADSTWNFIFTGTDANSSLTLDDSIVLNDGANLNLTNIPSLIIDGDLDLSKVNLTLAGTAIEVAAGDTLTLTAAQANGVTITGAGTVNITDLEDTLTANLGAIMTTAGDTGTVEVTVDTSDNDDADALPQDLNFTGALGVAHVTVSGDGSFATTDAMAGFDRDGDAATPADTTTFTVNSGATLNLTAAQSDERVVNGAGTTTVTINADTDADLSNITSTTVEADVTADATFTGNLGTAVTTVEDGFTMTTSYSIATGHTINDATTATPAHDGTGILAVTVAYDTANSIDESAADLSTITSNMDAAQITAAFVNTMTFTGNLDGHPATIGNGITVTADAATITGDAITGAGTMHVTNLDATLDADLSGVVPTTVTADFNNTGTFTGDLGANTVVTIADNMTMTTSVANAVNHTFNNDGVANVAPDVDGILAVTMSNADANQDTDNADGDGDATTGTFEALSYNLTSIAGNANFASVTVLDSLTFTGTLDDTVATGVADGATLSTTADIADNKAINMTGTTGAANIDMSADADKTLKGSANFTVTGLVSALTATEVTGNLDVTVADDTAMSVAVGGTGTNTIDADALSGGNELSVIGVDTAVTAHTVNGDIDASNITDGDGDTTTGGATLSGADGQNTIKGTDNDDIINGGIDHDALSGGAGDDTYIYDASLDIVTGETITDNDGTQDTIEIRTANALDLSLINSGNALEVDILDLNTSVGASDTNVTMTGTQLNGLSIIDANTSDSITVDTLDGLTMSATGATDTFVFAAGDSGVTLTSFVTGTDKIDLSDFETLGSIQDGAADHTVTNGQVVFLSTGTSGDADTASAAITALNNASTVTDAAATNWIVIADDDSTSIYQMVNDNNADEYTGATATLIGTIDAVLVEADILI